MGDGKEKTEAEEMAAAGAVVALLADRGFGLGDGAQILISILGSFALTSPAPRTASSQMASALICMVHDLAEEGAE